MSIVTNPKLVEFYRWLHAWPGPNGGGCTQLDLANEIFVGRTHLSQVLSGQREGRRTWARLVKVMPEEGLSLLRQCSAWNKHAEAAWQLRYGNKLPTCGDNGGLCWCALNPESTAAVNCPNRAPCSQLLSAIPAGETKNQKS